MKEFYMWSSPDQLEALAAVMREGSFERAGRVLSITTSAVSQRVKALESSAGRVLLTRGRPITATPAGQVLLRLAKQLEVLEQEALDELRDEHADGISIPVSVNADSLRTWLLPALVTTATEHGFAVDVHREDQDEAARLLRSGIVMAAITSDPSPMQGCIVRPLGALRYIPASSRAFRDRWFRSGTDAEALASAPTVVFDRSDRLLDRFLDEFADDGARPPRSYIPGSWEYVRAIELGLGWGVVPEPVNDGLVALSDEWHIDSPLFWHQWNLPSTQLTVLGDAVAAAGRAALRPIGRARTARTAGTPSPSIRARPA